MMHVSHHSLGVDYVQLSHVHCPLHACSKADNRIVNYCVHFCFEMFKQYNKLLFAKLLLLYLIKLVSEVRQMLYFTPHIQFSDKCYTT